MEKIRNLEIDILKGIGIVSVVLGNIYTGNFKDLIYTFHMPLFFFISGYLFVKKDSSVLNQIKYKTISQIIPYVVFLLISVAVIYPFNPINHSLKDNLNYFTQILLGGRNLFGVFWFITVLYFTNVLAIILFCKLSLQKIIVITSFMLLLGYLNQILIPTLYLPWNLHVVFMAFPFFIVGYCFKQIEFKINKIIFFMLTIFIILIGVSHFDVLAFDMKNTIYGIPLFSMIYAISFTIVLKNISKQISRLNFLSLIIIGLGKASLVIMYLHKIILYILRDKFLILNSFILFLFSILISYILYMTFTKSSFTRLLFLGDKNEYELFKERLLVNK